jgi:hypothetical protein
MIAAGYAREDDEPMSTPEPDSAVDAIANVVADLAERGWTDPQDIARAVLAHLREHPEHGPWPVMTFSDAKKLLTSYNDSDQKLLRRNFKSVIIIPDPDPPAASVPDWTANYLGVICSCGETSTDEVHKTPKTITCRECGKSWTINVVVEAANGGGRGD